MKIAVLGCGKMGSWLYRELSAQHEVVVYDADQTKAAKVAKHALKNLEELQSFSPDLLINAVSLQSTIPAFSSAIQFLPKTCVLSDVASVKGELPAFYFSCGFKFASIHPMFGPTFSSLDSLREENAIVIKEGDQETRLFFTRFFAGLGVKVFEFSFKEHDEMMAYSLTTPFISSLVFASCIDSRAVPGSTFSRHRKIATGLLAEDDHLLAEVLFNPHSVKQIEKINSKLEFLKHVIMDKDYAEAKKLFDKLRKNVG